MHRFYEPLVLLYVLDRTQGDRLTRTTADNSMEESPVQEVRRRFLDALSYICDFEKGGDTMTAIFVATEPLTYYFAQNKTPDQDAVDFLRRILNRLALCYDQNDEQQDRAAKEVLEDAVAASQKRLSAYRRFLRVSLSKCGEVLHGQSQLDGQLHRNTRRLASRFYSSRH